MMVIDNKFELKQIVFLKTDKDQSPGIVTGLLITPNGLQYMVSVGASSNYHYECELATEKDILLKTTD